MPWPSPTRAPPRRRGRTPSGALTEPSQVRVARVYTAPGEGDGERVLVDRLWPRGLRRDSEQFHRWLKEVAPSTELRRWYGHQEKRLAEFSNRYRGELGTGDAAAGLQALVELARSGPITLVTATRDLSLSAAMILAEVVRERLSQPQERLRA